MAGTGGSFPGIGEERQLCDPEARVQGAEYFQDGFEQVGVSVRICFVSLFFCFAFYFFLAHLI